MKELALEISDEEYDDIQLQASKLGMSINDFVKSCLEAGGVHPAAVKVEQQH